MRHLLIALLVLISLSYSNNDFNNSNVSIPWSDFKGILKDLKQDTAKHIVKPILPAELVINEASYEGRKWKENEFLIKGVLTVSVLENKKWVEIVLGRGLTLFPGVKINGRDANIGMKDNGSSFIILKSSGRYKIEYSFLIPQNISSGQSSLSFPMPGQTVAKIKLELDRPTYTVMANNRSLVVKKDRKKYYYEGGLGAGKKAYLNWRQETSSISGQQAMLMGQMNSIYSIGMGIIQLRSQINLNIIHKDIRKFSFVVPKTLDIIDLTGHAIATWEANDTLNKRIVTAYLKYNLRDNSTFLLNAECSYADSSKNISLPSLSIQNATRQEGTIGVGVLGNVELKPVDNSNNVLKRDKRELPAWFNDQGDVLYVYQYLSGNYSINLNLTPHGNIPVLDALATRGTFKSVIREDGKMVTQYDLNIRNRGEQFLRLKWRPEWQLWSVYCNNEPARPAFDTLNKELLVPLKKATDKTAETNVSLVFLSVQSKFNFIGKQEITYPTINMPIQNISGALYSPFKIKPMFESGNLKSCVSKGHKRWINFRSFVLGREVLVDHFAEPSLFQDKLAEAEAPAPSEIKSKEMKKIRRRPKKSIKREQLKGGFGNLIDELQAADLDVSQTLLSQSSLEAGQLSIPVVINFEGRNNPYSIPLLKEKESPLFSFVYIKGASKIPPMLELINTLLVLLSAIVFTAMLYKGFTKKKLLLGVFMPLIITFIICRVYDKVLYLDSFYNIPLLFVSLLIIIKIFKFLIKKIKDFKLKKSENIIFEEEESTDFNENKNDDKENNKDKSDEGKDE